jgi:two-component system, OmpR family, response regulator
MPRPRVLVVEDDSSLRSLLRRGLREEGLEVTTAANGASALAAAEAHPDALIIDIGLPDADGRDVCQALRARGARAPVLFLTARDAVSDRLSGFSAGGDDYLVKPFAFSELLARLEALLRRGAGPTTTTKLRVADLELDLLTRCVRRAGKAIEVLPREFRLLEYLMRNAGHVVTRTMLLEHVWEYHFDPQTNVIDVHISRLRQKIDKGFDYQLLHTVRGAGYCLRAPE